MSKHGGVKITGKCAVDALFNGEKVIVICRNGAYLDANSLSIQCFIDEKTKYFGFNGRWESIELEFYKAQVFNAEKWILERDNAYPLVECCKGGADGLWSSFSFHPRYKGIVLQDGDMID